MMTLLGLIWSLISAVVLLAVTLGLTVGLARVADMATESLGLDLAIAASTRSLVWLLGLYTAARFTIRSFGVAVDGWLGWTVVIVVLAIFYTNRKTLEDWSAGYMLRTEGVAHIGDVLSWKGQPVTLERVDLRVTCLRTSEGGRILVPNRTFAQEPLELS